MKKHIIVAVVVGSILITLYVVAWCSIFKTSSWAYQTEVIEYHETGNAGPTRSYAVTWKANFWFWEHRDWCDDYFRDIAEGNEPWFEYVVIALEPMDLAVAILLGKPLSTEGELEVEVKQREIISTIRPRDSTSGFEYPGDAETSSAIGWAVSAHVSKTYEK